MIPKRKLETVLIPIVFFQWLGMSPWTDNLNPKRIASISLTTLLILPLTVLFYNSFFYMSALCSGLALLYYMVLNLFVNKDFKKLLKTYHKLDSPFKEVKYTFSWMFLFHIIDIIFKVVVGYIKGVVISDVLILIYDLKQTEMHILVYILRCQSELLKHEELQDYRLVSRGLISLRSYLIKQLPVASFISFIWSSNTALLGVDCFSKIILTPHHPFLYCTCYWLSFLFNIVSMLALTRNYNGIEEQKEEFEDQLYWKLISSSQVWDLKSPKYMMLFEICSQEREETFKIDNTLIYSIITSAVTFLVVLVQFELEHIICRR